MSRKAAGGAKITQSTVQNGSPSTLITSSVMLDVMLDDMTVEKYKEDGDSITRSLRSA